MTNLESRSMTATQLATSTNWIDCRMKLPENGKAVNTKIDDWRGCRNEQQLKRQDRLWFFPDGSMYVYYTPTHWSEL